MDEKPARNHRFCITHDTTIRLYITRRPYALGGAKRPTDDDGIALQNILFHRVLYLLKYLLTEEFIAD